MLLTSLEMAQRLEEADSLHITRQVEACAQIFPDHRSFAVPIGHGVAAITLPSFGPKLNRITGWGRAERVSEKDLLVVEDLFAKNGVDTEINLCPLADPSAFQVLASRGYSVIGFINVYVRVLTDEDLKEVKVEGASTSRVPAERVQEFPSWSVAGYRDTRKPELLLEALARSAALRADTSLYIATIDGKVAGSAGMALIETAKGGVAHFYIDSTLPEYRGRGIQAALLRARLADARKAGFHLASIAARPGDGSCRNIERAGFSLAYTTARCVKAHK
jgi:GNAT superfamily N-acetyltransferase